MNTYIIVIGVVIGALSLVNVVLNHLKERNQAREEKRKDEILIGKQDEIIRLTQEVSDATRRAEEAKDNMLALQKEMNGYITGGNSFPVIAAVEIFEISKSQIEINLGLLNEGEFPLEDLEIVVLEKFDPLRSSNIFLETIVSEINIPKSIRIPQLSPAHHIAKGRSYVKELTRRSISNLAPMRRENIVVLDSIRPEFRRSGDKMNLIYNIYIASKRQAWVIFFRAVISQRENGQFESRHVVKVDKIISDGTIELFTTKPPYPDELLHSISKKMEW